MWGGGEFWEDGWGWVMVMDSGWVCGALVIEWLSSQKPKIKANKLIKKN